MFKFNDEVVCINDVGDIRVAAGREYVVRRAAGVWVWLCGIEYPTLASRFTYKTVSPSWHDKPTGPGLWWCEADDAGGRMEYLTQDRIDGTFVSWAKHFYGPIPSRAKADPAAQEAGQ